MAFWSAEKLRERLPEITDDPDISKIDGAAYTLTIGPEYYVSPSERRGRIERSIHQLAKNEAFVIPPGQFAFLITEERVRIPHDTMALISIKARVKFRGLLNVSGFHVDPGYSGRLIFSVLNAGPATIHLRRGDWCFLIWWVDLDRPSRTLRQSPGFDHIPTELVNNIAGEFKTIEGLSKRIDRIVTEQRITRALVVAIVSAIIGLAVSRLFTSTVTPATAGPSPTRTPAVVTPARPGRTTHL